MSILPLSLSRVTDLMRNSVATQNINTTQAQLVKVEQELTTGKAVNVASDNPASAAMIQQLQTTLSFSTQYSSNISLATTQLNETDSTLGSITTLLTQAQSIASSNVSDTTGADARTQAATVVDSIYNQILSLANSQYNGTYLFGTNNATSAPYNQSAGGIEFMGSTTTLQNTFEQGAQLAFQADPATIFGGESSSVSTGTNLTPELQATDRLSDLAGATGKGVTLGSIQIANGTSAVTVDLSGANSVGDVVSDINAAGLTGVTASVGQYGIQLTATGGAQISVNEVGGDSTAQDLGILQPAQGAANAPVTGQNLGSKVTSFTTLSALDGGTGIDPTGFNISNGTTSVDISLAGLTTVQDLVNAVNHSGTGARAQINATGTGIDLVNATQGDGITVSENGGTTASQLGFRTFSPDTALSGLNSGAGVSQPSGNQFSITTADGAVTNISLSGATTVQDVINQINTQATGKVTASFATTGNGIVLTDDTTGAVTLAVTPLNAASTAADLGLTTSAVSGVITGTDVNPIKVTGVFSDLAALSAALRTDDTNGITAAAQSLTKDSEKVSDANATVGAQVQELTNRSSDLSSQTLANQTLLSHFQDVDYTTAVTQYQTLQTSLQAALEVTSKSLSMSLLNYIS